MGAATPPLLRTRRGLMFTALPAIAVLAILGVSLAVSHRHSVVEDRYAETRTLAAAAATNAGRFIGDQVATLSAVAASPAVREGRRPQVDPYLRTVAGTGRYSAGMGLVGLDGRLRASSEPIPAGGVSLADRPYVRTALDEGRAAVSDVVISRTRRRPVIAFAHPVSSLAGPRNGVVLGWVRLDAVGTALKRLLYAPGAGVVILDGANHVLAAERPVRRIEAAPRGLPVREMRRREVGVLDAVETADGKRLLGYAMVPGATWLVIVDQDHDEVIGPLDDALWAEIVALAILAVLGLLLTLASARRLDRLDAQRDAALAEQRDIAVRLQRSLLPDVPAPPALQVHASYAPAHGAMAVGGDWYDVVELGDGRVAISVGDVAGHGLKAAAAMGQLRSAVRTLALARTPPAEALGQLDRFAALLDDRPLATVVIGVLDPAAGTLRYAVAGHPPPLLLREGAATELLEQGRSPLLGVQSAEPRTEGLAHIGPGDTLVLYTDGLVEQPGSDIDSGIAALMRRAEDASAQDPETLASALVAGVGEPRRDDTAVLCVRLAPAAQPSSVPS